MGTQYRPSFHQSIEKPTQKSGWGFEVYLALLASGFFFLIFFGAYYR